MRKIVVILSFLIFAVLLVFSYKYLSKMERGELENTSETESVRTVKIENFPIEFDLPKGYGVYVSGGYEGGYELRVNLGKILRDGYLYEVAPTIFIRDFAPQTQDSKTYTPSQYVDFVFINANPEINRPKILTLFGNKAVLIYDDAGGDPFIVGYLRGDQLPESFGRKDYSITIDGGTYGSGKEFNQELFDLVVNSLRIK